MNQKRLNITLIIIFIAVNLTGCQQSSEEGVTTPPPQPTPLPTQTFTPVPTPTATPTPIQRKDVRIVGVMIGRGLDKHNEIKNPSSNYQVGDLIFAIVRTSGSGPEATIKLRCKDASGNVVFEESQKVTVKGSAVTSFTLNSEKNLSPGQYSLQGLLDEYPTMGVGFEVSK